MASRFVRWCLALTHLGSSKPDGGQDPRTSASDDINEATVLEMLKAIRSLVASEDSRAESFNSRASSLAGFAGLIISVSAALATRVFGLRLDGVDRWVDLLSFAAGIALLVAAVGFAVFGVLVPVPTSTLTSMRSRSIRLGNMS
jgi:hypothetical protein